MTLMSTRIRLMGLPRLVCLLLAFFLCFSAPSLTYAYSVRYKAIHSDSGATDFEVSGLCNVQDPASHTMMPIKESFQGLAVEAYKEAGLLGEAPIGGIARQAACFDQNCSWQFNHGLYLHNELTFFKGVIYKGRDKTEVVEGVYNNFKRHLSPVSWEKGSFWGKRQTYMFPNGSWANIEIAHQFKDWVCEYYEYNASDHVFFPTYPDGNPIVPPLPGKGYRQCGKPIELDAQGRWILRRCPEPAPWYINLVITICVTIAVFVLIVVIILTCRCVRRRRREDKMKRLMTVGMENPARIPTQSQINMTGSMFMNDLEEY